MIRTAALAVMVQVSLSSSLASQSMQSPQAKMCSIDSHHKRACLQRLGHGGAPTLPTTVDVPCI